MLAADWRQRVQLEPSDAARLRVRRLAHDGSSWDDKQTIEDQLLYTLGHFNADNSVGRLDNLVLSNIVKTENAGKITIKYHAKLPVAWGRKTDLRRATSFGHSNTYAAAYCLVPIGRANVARSGSDLTVVAHSYATVRALHVAERLAESHGVSIEVVDLRSLRPLDVETVAGSVARTHRALCVEEGWPTYGVSAELAARIQHACFDDLDAPVERVGMAEVPLPYAKNLESAASPTRAASRPRCCTRSTSRQPA